MMTQAQYETTVDFLLELEEEFSEQEVNRAFVDAEEEQNVRED